jgi:hypothetical protein
MPMDSISLQLFMHYKLSSLIILFMVLQVGYGHFMDLSAIVTLSANHYISEIVFPTSQANSVTS